MPIILVVDDSDVDRLLMKGLLSADVDWLVSQAKNGVEAVDMVTYALPDVVVTDLNMPEMDGMQLVSHMAESFPEVPVILVTGTDDSKIALRALRHGAASFVPKQQLAESLLETVEQVLAVRDADHYDERIVQLTTNTRYRFVLGNDPTLISPIVDRIQQGMIAMQLCSATQRMHIGIALEEALLNAMLHGNLEIPAEKLTETRNLLHEGKTSPIVEERRQEQPYADRTIHVAADFNRSRAQLVVGDSGSGFDVDAKWPASGDESINEEAGRGLVLIRTFMDEVLFNETGNELRMTLNNLRPVVTPAAD
ncbi:Transcriptional regulatory protein DegU [Stieleria maiorica]|uniref:Transcriptional regulatory protein DegU n=1 Tax=Stieleria maiorica TaxID=2795974 RepID=A0A5B9MAD8_9BACT|nr:response regulator [Stieleria maiorica]QEF98251.1 Transcriptional regulatory protein DegU [Stieleria maiorica]